MINTGACILFVLILIIVYTFEFPRSSICIRFSQGALLKLPNASCCDFYHSPHLTPFIILFVDSSVHPWTASSRIVPEQVSWLVQPAPLSASLVGPLAGKHTQASWPMWHRPYVQSCVDKPDFSRQWKLSDLSKMGRSLFLGGMEVLLSSII